MTDPKHFWSRFTKTDHGCLVWQGATYTFGYGHVQYEGRHTATHRVAWQLANGPIPPGLLVCHKCDNPPCGNPDHLFLGTHKDNAVDMVNKGRRPVTNAQRQSAPFHVNPPRGVLNVKAKLTPEKVAFMRHLYMSRPEFNQENIAFLVGVAQNQASRVIRGEHWPITPQQAQ